MSDIVERLMNACNGHPHAKIPWPHRVLHDAADEIKQLRLQLEQARDKCSGYIAVLGEVNEDISGYADILYTLDGRELDAEPEVLASRKEKSQ